MLVPETFRINANRIYNEFEWYIYGSLQRVLQLIQRAIKKSQLLS